MGIKRLGLVVAVLFAAAGCGPPKYVTYRSIHGDWKASVPWGWNVITDDEKKIFTATNFLGPFEPDFFLGIPSLSVRWYTYGVPHNLRDGGAEVYFDDASFIKGMLKDVYGPRFELDLPVREILVGDNRKARQFIVLSPVEAPAGARWGLSEEPATSKVYNFRRHGYVVVPMNNGFYVIVYPATRDGYKLYEKQFTMLVNSFTVLTDGPGGPKAEAPKVGFVDKAKDKPFEKTKGKP